MTEIGSRYGVTRVIERALRRAYPSEQADHPEARKAFAAVTLIDDMLALLPPAEDMAAFMAMVYAQAKAQEGDTLRIALLRDSYTRIEQALGGVRNYYVTADYGRLVQAEALMREVYQCMGLSASRHVRLRRGDEIGFECVGALIVGEYPSGWQFEVGVHYDRAGGVWRLDGGAHRSDDAGHSTAADVGDIVLGPLLHGELIPHISTAVERMIRVCSGTPVPLERVRNVTA